MYSNICNQATPKELTIICCEVFKLDRELSCITTIFGKNASESLSLQMSEAQKNYNSLDRVSLRNRGKLSGSGVTRGHHCAPSLV